MNFPDEGPEGDEDSSPVKDPKDMQPKDSNDDADSLNLGEPLDPSDADTGFEKEKSPLQNAATEVGTAQNYLAARRWEDCHRAVREAKSHLLSADNSPDAEELRQLVVRLENLIEAHERLDRAIDICKKMSPETRAGVTIELINVQNFIAQLPVDDVEVIWLRERIRQVDLALELGRMRAILLSKTGVSSAVLGAAEQEVRLLMRSVLGMPPEESEPPKTQ